MTQKKKLENENDNIFLDLYVYAISELDLLREYYKCTSYNLIKNRIEIEEKYKTGLKINSYFEKFVNKNNILNTELYEEIKNEIIFDDIKFNDIITNVSVDEKNRVTFTISDTYRSQDQFNPNIARKRHSAAKEYEYILFRSVISDLVITFESLLAKIYKTLILSNPFPHLKNEQLPLADFFQKDFSKKISEKLTSIIEGRMYNAIEVLDEIINVEKIDIDKDILLSFKELYYRRNILIHNDSKINKKYLDSIDSKFRKGLKIGQSIICDQVYIESCLDTVYVLFFYIFYGLLKKYDREIDYMEKIDETIFKKLQNKLYNVTKPIYKKLSTDNSLQFISKATYRINYINSIKQLGEKELLNTELKNLDLSIATDNFKIAQLCLEDNNEEVYKLLTSTYPESFNAQEIKEWPLFLNFRQTEQYEKFCLEHSDDFNEEQLIEPSIE